jgi:predicted MFS family arabinose efflux permease
LAASLAHGDERGRVIGQVMTGLLLGILLSRVAAGLIAEVAGWRSVFVVAAALMVVTASLIHWKLPIVPPTSLMSYFQLLRSVAHLVRDEPVLRERMLYGAATFASFGVFWTSVGFVLASEPFNWGDARIGLFTLFGIAGAMAANVAGTLADKGYARVQTGVFIFATATSFVILGLGRSNWIALAVGMALLDLGVQGTQISNQSLFYPLRPDAQSRLNTAYMTAYFAAGSLGSGLSAIVFSSCGWGWTCVLGATFPTIGFVMWALERTRARRSKRRQPTV